jgi:osmotically-inducible protein OsmY
MALLALGGCGGHPNPPVTAQPGQANVEINRQGMRGAEGDRHARHIVPVATSTSMRAPPQPAQQVAATENDTRIAADVNSYLLADPALAPMKIGVHSEDGAVTLAGTAPDPAARGRAEQMARAVTGVHSVDNQLTVGEPVTG